MNTKHLIIILLATFVLGCKNENSQSETSSAIHLEGLTLNNNQKWIANKETHIGMKRIDSILENNTSYNGKTLGESLSRQTSYIIKSCNMKGEAHDQLHLVLVPMLEIITDLKNLDNNLLVKQNTITIKQLTTTYFQYFKIK